VLEMQRDEAIPEAALGDPGLYLGGEVVKPASACGERQFVESLVEHAGCSYPG
jgi:hypothetical protein